MLSAIVTLAQLVVLIICTWAVERFVFYVWPSDDPPWEVKLGVWIASVPGFAIIVVSFVCEAIKLIREMIHDVRS